MIESEAIKIPQGMSQKGICEDYKYEMAQTAIQALEKQKSKNNCDIPPLDVRRCSGYYFKNGSHHDFKLGYFHQWGCDFEEFESGTGNYSVAIVELPNGEIVTPLPNNIKFIDNIGG